MRNFPHPSGIIRIRKLDRRANSVWPTLTLPLLVLSFLAGCDIVEPDPASHLRGTYVLRMFQGYPLPYFDYRTQESRLGGFLHLGTRDRYEKVDSAGYGELVTTGTFLLRQDKVALVSNAGDVESYEVADGILKSPGAVYVREGREIPPEYTWRLYRLGTCDGLAPTTVDGCGGKPVYASLIWLTDSHRYYLADSGPGATTRRSGSYAMTGEEILMPGMPAERYVGTLRGDSLMLGTWLYLRRE